MKRIARRALPVLAVLGVLLPSITAHAEPPPVQRELTVATFNIHHGAGPDDVLDLAHAADVIAGAGMDVVGLQEVDRHWGERSDFVDQARILADELGMHVVFGANLDREPPEAGQPRRQYGLAILSRYPIVDSQHLLLPNPEDGEQRGLLEAVLDVAGTPLRFYSTHLQHDSREERLAQVEAINAVLADTEDSTVLVGDLNAEPDAPAVQLLGTHLYDTWPVAGDGDGYTFDVDTPHARIDYVFAGEDVRAESARVLDTDASDHLPVAVDVTLSAVPGMGGR